MSTKKHYSNSNKRFLSDRSGEYGTIAWEINATEYYSGEYVPDKVDTDASLRLTDCYQIINLDFCSRKPQTQDERIEKVDNMINSLQEFRKALIECNEVCQEHNDSLTPEDIENKKKTRRGRLTSLLEDDDDDD